MKPSYVIAAVVLVLLALAAILLYGQADGPTSLTDSNALAKQTLPPELGVLIKPANESGESDTPSPYEHATELVLDQPNVLTRTPEHDRLVDALCDLLLKGAGTSNASAEFADSQLAVELGAEPEFVDTIELIAEWTLQRSAYLYTHGEPDKARELTLAVWLFGRRMFEDNVRLYNRNTGLDMMESAGGMLYEMAADDPTLDAQALKAWADALNAIRKAWQPKLELMLGVDPHPGDLVNIAMHDEDLTFRIEATLRCGLHRHGVDRGNRRAMQRAIDAAIGSDEPMLNLAGVAADAFTLKDRRRFY